MTKISFQLEHKETKANLQIEDGKSHHADMVIEGLFGAIGVNVPKPLERLPIMTMKTPEVPQGTWTPTQHDMAELRSLQGTTATLEPTVSWTPPSLPQVPIAEAKPEPIKKPEIIKPDFVNRNPNPMTATVREYVEARNHPMQTGIKLEPDGSKTYKALYHCPNELCNDKGYRFVKETNDYCKCRNCGTKIMIRYATTKGFPDHDEDMNYFVADSHYE